MLTHERILHQHMVWQRYTFHIDRFGYVVFASTNYIVLLTAEIILYCLTSIYLTVSLKLFIYFELRDLWSYVVCKSIDYV